MIPSPRQLREQSEVEDKKIYEAAEVALVSHLTKKYGNGGLRFTTEGIPSRIVDRLVKALRESGWNASHEDDQRDGKYISIGEKL